MNVTTYGVDTAKSVFHLYWVDPQSGEIHRKKLSRAKFVEFFSRREPGCVAMEACGGAHHWGRLLQSMGHQVQLLPAQRVRAKRSGNKDDAADARAVWEASNDTALRRVPVKSCEQQAALAVHRVRSHWVSVRTASVNALRGLLYEFGVVIPKGREVLIGWLAQHRAEFQDKLPATMVQLLDAHLQALRELDAHIRAAEVQIKSTLKTTGQARRLHQVPGVGVLGATALAATLGDGSGWKNAREFAACMGLVPRHSGTGGKVRMGAITKRGDSYLRTLLVHGARNLVRTGKPAPWIVAMLRRRPFNVVVVAVAHKMARTAWAMVARDQAYNPSLGPTSASAA